MTKIVLLLLSTDRFSFPLIRYLILEGRRYGWKTCVGSMFEANITERIKQEKFGSDLTYINITDFRQCDHAIRKADLVIGMMPDVMMLQVADSCVEHGKSFISPSKLSNQMFSRKAEAEENGSLLLFECGFSPGLDHVTAKKAIDNIHLRGGEISSFKTYSGSLAADESIHDNPWHFKLTEATSDVINMGKSNNRHLVGGKLQHVPYHQLFLRAEEASIAGIENIVTIPEGDSLYYRDMYQLSETATVIKGKLLKKGFDTLWQLIITLGLTDNLSKIDMGEDRSFYAFIDSLVPYAMEGGSLEEKLKNYTGAHANEIQKLKWLGLFEKEWMDGYKNMTPSSVLQHLLEKKFSMKQEDKDCIIIQHQLEYAYKNIQHKFTATMVTKGENSLDSATAKAIGLTAGAAAKAILLGNIDLTGIYTPTNKAIYEPILAELDDLGVAFDVEEEKGGDIEINAIINQSVTA